VEVEAVNEEEMEKLGKQRGYTVNPGIDTSTKKRNVQFKQNREQRFMKQYEEGTGGYGTTKARPFDYGDYGLGSKTRMLRDPVILSAKAYAIGKGRTAGFFGIVRKDRKEFGRRRMMIDSGATVHCSSNKGAFVSMEPTSIQCTAADGSRHRAQGIGTMELHTKSKTGKTLKLTLNGVLYIPAFDVDVISTSKLRAQGFDVHLPANKLGFLTTTSGEQIDFCHGTDGLEYFDQCDDDGESVAAVGDTKRSSSDFNDWLKTANLDDLEVRASEPEPGDREIDSKDGIRHERIRSRLADLGKYHPQPEQIAKDLYLYWHHRLGHANARVVAAALKNSLPPKAWKRFPKIIKRFCDSCERTKATIHKSKKTNRSLIGPEETNIEDGTSDKPWLKFSCDTYSFAKESIVDGHRHVLVAIDHYSNSAKLIGMKSLKQVPEAMNDLLHWIRTGYSSNWNGRTPHLVTKPVDTAPTSSLRTPILVKTDGAQYFKSKAIDDIYKKYGTKHTMSSSRSLWRNGKCERLIRTISESSNAMRAARKLGTEYQWLSFVHAANIHQVLPTSANPANRTPYTMLTGKPASLEHIQPFGCKCVVTRPSRGADQDRGILGIHIGYASDTRSFRVLLPPTDGKPHYSVADCVRSEDGALPRTIKHRSIESLHVSFEDELPRAVIEGAVPLEWPEYEPYSILDYNQPILETPNDRSYGDEDTIDVDFHYRNERVANIGIHHHHNNSSVEEFSEFISLMKNEPPPWNTALQRADVADEGSLPRINAVNDVINGWHRAKHDKHSELYQAALEKEQGQMFEKGVLQRVRLKDVPKGKKIYQSMMLFTLKRSPKNEITHGKARWVFRGDLQTAEDTEDDIASYTPQFSSIRMIMAEAAKRACNLITGDVPGAYLFGETSKQLYMSAPAGLKETDDNGDPIVYKINNNTYGRVDACGIYLKFLNQWLTERGWEQNDLDKAVYRRGKTIMAIYIDDILLLPETPDIGRAIMAEFNDFFGDCKFDAPSMYLGCNVSQDKTTKSIYLSNQALLERLAERFMPGADITAMHNVRTPFPASSNGVGGYVKKADCPDLEAGEPRLDQPYRELIGALNYCVTCTRPDLAIYLHLLSRVAENPGQAHWDLALHTLKYAVGTRDFGINYHSTGKSLKFYVDSSWADGQPDYKTAARDIYHDETGRIVIKRGEEYLDPNDPEARRSTWCYIGTHASGPVTWKCKAHKGRRSLSSTEAELQAAAECAKEIVYLKEVARQMGIETGTIPMMEDNQGCIHLCLQAGLSSRSKHFELRLMYVKDLEREGILHIEKKHTSEQLADIGTKVLGGQVLLRLQDGLLSRGLHTTILTADGRRTAPTWT